MPKLIFLEHTRFFFLFAADYLQGFDKNAQNLAGRSETLIAYINCWGLFLLNRLNYNRKKMKSQLERILNSDLSEYKIAVSQHITNLDHFQECLTQRSNFMQKFNKLLEQELERMNKEPPTDFDSLNIIQESKQQALKELVFSSNRKDMFDHEEKGKINVLYNNRPNNLAEELKYHNKQNYKALNSSTKNNELKDDLKQNMEYSFKDIKLSEHSIQRKNMRDRLLRLEIMGLESRKDIKTLKDYIVCEIKKLSQKVSKQFQNVFINIQTHYQEKINSLQATVTQILQQNLQLKSEKQFQNNLNQYHKQTHFQRENIRVEQETQRHDEQFVMKLTTDRQYSDLQYSPPTISLLDKLRKPQQKSQQQLQNYTILSNYLTTTNEFQMNPQMTIKNKKQNWKYYTCDLQFPQFKQIKNSTKSMLNLNLIDEKNSHLGLEQRKKQQINSEPILPSLLKRKVYQHFDLPTIRTLVVSYPPVQEGFAVLSLGNEVVYKGMWKYRKFHGKGKLTLPEYIYQGDFRHGLFHGLGALKLGNMQYIGLFQQNKASGEGTLKIGHKNITGIWLNNSLVQQF